MGMKMFQAAVVGLGAVMAVLDHYQVQQQAKRVSAVATHETHVSEDRGAGGLEPTLRKEAPRLLSADERQFEAEPLVAVSESDFTQSVYSEKSGLGAESLSMLIAKAPHLSSQILISSKELKVLSDAHPHLQMPFERQATHHNEVGFVPSSVGLFPAVRWNLNDPNFDPEKAGVAWAFSEPQPSTSLKPKLNRFVISVGCFSQSLAVHYSRSLTSRTDIGVVAGTSVGGFRTPGRGWNVSETLVVDAVGTFQWVGMVLNHRPFHLHGLGQHLRVQMGLYSGNNNVELTSRNSGNVLEGSWSSRASVYLGIGGDLSLANQLSLMVDAGGVCIASPRILRGSPTEEMVDVAKSVAETRLFGQCRLGLSWSF